jgi:transposase
MLKVDEHFTIQQLAAQGWPHRRIAPKLQIDRKTARRYLAQAAKSATISILGSAPPDSPKSPISSLGLATGRHLVAEALRAEAGWPSLCQTHCQLINAELELELTAQRIYQEPGRI